MKIVFRRDAAADLRDIADYYDSLGLARTGEHIISAIDYSVMLRAQPGFHRAAPRRTMPTTTPINLPSLLFPTS